MTATFTINENEIRHRTKNIGWNYQVMMPRIKLISTVKRPIGTVRTTGVVIQENAKTVLVNMGGTIIKRHKVKHNVELTK